MPTGYTANIAKGITFEQFVMQCARAMGALIMMRDEPLDAEIPERFEPSDYHVKKLEELRKEQAVVANMGTEDTNIQAKKEYEKECDQRKNTILEHKGLQVKYEAMLREVNNWVPPSSDYNKFKSFMIDQLTRSIKFDCNTEYYTNNLPVELTGVNWWIKEKTRIDKDILYHEKENAKEIERTEGRNQWIKQLRDSLVSHVVKSATHS
jgi:hypothetical protein